MGNTEMSKLISIVVLLLTSTTLFAQIIKIEDQHGDVFYKKISEVNKITFGTPPAFSKCGDIVTDNRGASTVYYETIQIGDQCWLKENLDVGTMINSTTSGYQQTNNNIIEKYCFDNNPANCEIYGGLYEWPEVMQYTTTEGAQGICPDGWHIPTLAEFEELETFVGDQAAKLVREDQPTSGYTPTNETGFSALFAGLRYYYSIFDCLGSYAFFWSSTESNSSLAYHMHLHYYFSNVGNLFDYATEGGFSVRCVQD